MDTRWCRLLSVAVLAMSVACTGSGERAAIDRFFSASRLLDRTALANVATVIFDPATSGTVLSFDIQRITAGHQAGLEDVVVLASVHAPDGSMITKTLTLTLERQPEQSQAISPWMVTAVRAGDERR